MTYFFRSTFERRGAVLEQFSHGGSGIAGDGVDQALALGMHGAGVEWMRAVADAEKAGGLLEGLRTEAGNLQAVPGGT